MTRAELLSLFKRIERNHPSPKLGERRICCGGTFKHQENCKLLAAIRWLESDESGYVVEPLALGWFCPKCKVWNGDAKEFLVKCRSCEADRPKVGT